MPCPLTTALARATEQLHAVQMERAEAAKSSGNRARLSQLDRTLIQLNRAHDAAVRAWDAAQRRNRNTAREAAE